MIGISRSTGHSNGGALRDDGIDRGQGRRTARLMRRFGVSNTVLLIICLMYLILYVDRVNISTAAPLIKADLGLSNTQLGLAFSAFAYPYAPRRRRPAWWEGSPVYSPPGLLWVSAKAPHSRLPLAP